MVVTSSLVAIPQVDVIFIDFNKTFDNVSQRKVFYKLYNLGIPSKIVTWFSPYVLHRKEFVDVGGGWSEMMDVRSGVPKGSVLGPLLFLIYVNNIVDVVDLSG